jgi:hypothetical protein
MLKTAAKMMKIVVDSFRDLESVKSGSRSASTKRRDI